MGAQFYAFTHPALRSFAATAPAALAVARVALPFTDQRRPADGPGYR